jgi:hypothetical protein
VPEGTLTVERMDGRRIDRVHFRPAPVPAGDEPDDAVVPEHQSVPLGTGSHGTAPRQSARPAFAGSTAVRKADR